MKKSTFTLLSFFVFICCVYSQTTTVNYTQSSAAIPNPERGFYQHTETHSNAYDPLEVASLMALRNGYTSSGANYSTPVTLILRVFYLENFVASSISATYLDKMQDDFDAARSAGVKMIVRFAYTQDVTPPYNDAPKIRILSHITQLSPVLTANIDVIAAFQMGFIGAWGEGYYTDYFGVPGSNLTATNWNDRTEVLNALLAAVPASRQVQVRVPQYKQKAVYGSSAPVTSAASGGRIGHHNDCFLASFADSGTYTNYDIQEDDTLHLKPYTANDTGLKLAMGGETCDPNGTWSRCASAGGVADTELKRFHYSYLNADYNHNVNNSWTPCFANINNRLGYRLALQSGTYPNMATAGGTIALDFSIKNEGYAKPFNTRPVEFILRNTSTQVRYYATAQANPQDWSLNIPETENETFCLPGDIPAGNYELLLNLPDPILSLYPDPDYSIRLANTGTWESATGYNKLNHTISISGSGTCSGHPVFALGSGILPVDMIDFYGENETAGVRLHWITGSEKNVSYFEIQHSTDGVRFEVTGEVAAQSTASRYTFLDKNRPYGTPLFYRLKTVDLDGSSTFSKIVFIPASEKRALQIVENPAGDLLRFRIKGNNAGGLFDFKIIAADGRVMLSGQSEGEILISALPVGWYGLWVLGEEGVLVGRFLKGK